MKLVLSVVITDSESGVVFGSGYVERADVQDTIPISAHPHEVDDRQHSVGSSLRTLWPRETPMGESPAISVAVPFPSAVRSHPAVAKGYDDRVARVHYHHKTLRP